MIEWKDSTKCLIISSSKWQKGDAMEEYWNMLSGEHHQKLTALAQKSEVDLNTALRNIIRCLEGQNEGNVCCAVTARQIEEMIDTLTV